MNNIPTAEEMGIKWEEASMNAMGTSKQGSPEISLAYFFKEFAKLHVEAALKAVSNHESIQYDVSSLNAYPLTNIK